MRDTLSFVRGAVADKEGAIPALTRFCISGGRIQGSNGRLVIDAPCPELEGIEALVPADRFLNAIDACEGEPDDVSITDAGRLMIRRGKFKASLPLQPVASFPRATPTEGAPRSWSPALLSTLARLRPFIGEDSTRQWCLTIVADGERAYATNSAMIGSLPAPGLQFQLPVFLIDELLRIGTDPGGHIIDASSITFFYGSSWLRSQLIIDEFPLKTAQRVTAWDDKLKRMPDDLVAKIESILPFCLDRKYPLIHFTDKGISTTPGETQAEIEGAGWPPLAFDARNLLPMLRAATHFGIDPASGRGLVLGEGGFRGALMGRKIATSSNEAGSGATTGPARSSP